MDFKVRALDFLSIYVKTQTRDQSLQLTLIQGLLRALTVAHKDKHTILFDRIKSVLTAIAKSSVKPSDNVAMVEEKGATGCKMLMTEL